MQGYGTVMTSLYKDVLYMGSLEGKVSPILSLITLVSFLSKILLHVVIFYS